MATSDLVREGRIAWTGDNSGIFLRQTPDGPYVSLASYFRVTLSPFGGGHMALVVTTEDRPRQVCLYDNRRLAQWLVSEFAAHFPQFRGVLDTTSLEYEPIRSHSSAGDYRVRVTECFSAGAHQLELYWDEIGTPFLVDLPASRSATGRHEMVSLFADVGRAGGTFDGVPLRGDVHQRDLHGRASTSAFIALSETWLAPAQTDTGDRQ